MATQSWGESNRLEKAKQALRAMLPQAILNWREVHYFGKYGEVEMHLLKFLCRHDQDAIDIGANYGGYVHFMRRHASRVLAFEPITEFVDLLRRKFPRDVMIEPIALSDRAGGTELYVPMIDGAMVSGCSTLSTDASLAYPAHRVLKVRMDRLDNVYGGTVGFIKIDVEGHEQAVLDGAVETIDRCRPRILVEIDERLSPGGLERAKAYFSRLGYRGHYVHRGRLEPIEKFSSADLQNPSNMPDLTASLRERPRFEDYINNFIFLPADEPQGTLDGIREHLTKLSISRDSWRL
jgi:FkbM family methyltransferase